MNKIFSIIIPVYNSEELLQKTLDSIVCQESGLYECIIIDGKSSDDTMSIVRKYKNRFPYNITYISEQDNGVYDAMNKGIEISQGEYLYFIGAGDTLEKDCLAQVKKYLSFNLEIVCGNVYKENEKKIEDYILKKEDIVNFVMCHQRIFYSKRVFHLLGKYNLKYKISSDAEFNIKVFTKEQINKKYVDILVAKYLGNGISDKNIDKQFEQDHFKIIKENFKEDFKNIFKHLPDIKKRNKKLIGWSASSGYKKIKEKYNLNLEYIIDSDKNKQGKYIDNIKIYESEKVLKENKNDIYILIFSQSYYHQISLWLTKNGFKEYENFYYCSDKLLDVIYSNDR